MKEEVVGAIVSDKEVGAAVVIVVCHTHAHALAYVRPEAPLIGHILKGAIAFIQE